MKTDTVQHYLVAFLCSGWFASSAAGLTVDLDDVSLYAGGTLTFEGSATVGEGAVVAVGQVMQFGSRLNVESIYGEAGFSSGGDQAIRGPMYFNNTIRNLDTSFESLNGDITSATGNIIFGNFGGDVLGDLTAAGNIIKPFSLDSMTGNIQAGGDVFLEGDVQGNVTYGGTFTQGTSSDVSGTVRRGGPVTPELFVAPTLPSYSPIQAGLNDINLDTFEDITLAPGRYGELNMASSNTVSLSAGTYIFENILSDFSLNELSFDTSGGAIEVLIAADTVSLDLIQSINGERLFAGNTPDPEQAELITLRLGGSLTLGRDFYGDIIAPDGDITLEFPTSVLGKVWAGGDVWLGGSTEINVVSTIDGDYNADGFVSQADLDMILLNWGGDDLPGNFTIDDSPFDGLVSQNELDNVLLNWGDGTPPDLSAIPEPTALSLVGIGALSMFHRRRGA